MANVKTGSALGMEILAAVGIDSKGIRKLTLVCEAGDIATLTIEHTIFAAGGEIAEVIKRYKLTEAE